MEANEPLTLAAVVAKNVRETRRGRGLTTREMSDRLVRLGVTFAPSSVSKAEADDPAKRRRLDVGDLAALALALDTTPWHLLTPKSRDGVMLTPGYGPVGGKAVSDWLRGQQGMHRGEPLVTEEDGTAAVDQSTRRLHDDSPPWAKHEHGRNRSPWLYPINHLRASVVAEANDDPWHDDDGVPHTRAQRAATLRRELRSVVASVELMAEQLEREDA